MFPLEPSSASRRGPLDDHNVVDDLRPAAIPTDPCMVGGRLFGFLLNLHPMLFIERGDPAVTWFIHDCNQHASPRMLPLMRIRARFDAALKNIVGEHDTDTAPDANPSPNASAAATPPTGSVEATSKTPVMPASASGKTGREVIDSRPTGERCWWVASAHGISRVCVPPAGMAILLHAAHNQTGSSPVLRPPGMPVPRSERAHPHGAPVDSGRRRRVRTRLAYILDSVGRMPSGTTVSWSTLPLMQSGSCRAHSTEAEPSSKPWRALDWATFTSRAPSHEGESLNLLTRSPPLDCSAASPTGRAGLSSTQAGARSCAVERVRPS